MKSTPEVETDDKFVRVGNKPLASYLLAVAVKFRQKHEEVVLSGFGRQIGKTHALARALTDLGLSVKSIDTTSYQLTTEQGKREIPGVYITIVKKK